MCWTLRTIELRCGVTVRSQATFILEESSKTILLFVDSRGSQVGHVPCEDALRALHGRLLPSVDFDNLLRQCLVRHSRLFLHLVTGEPVAPTSERPHPFAHGLRRWLGWMLGDLMTQLSACFSGGRHDALLFLRNLLNVRLAHATAALSAHGYTRRGVDASVAEVSDTMVSDMLALIDTHHHETFTQAD